MGNGVMLSLACGEPVCVACCCSSSTFEASCAALKVSSGVFSRTSIMLSPETERSFIAGTTFIFVPFVCIQSKNDASVDGTGIADGASIEVV